MPFISENKLEEALVRAVKSPATAPDFYRDNLKGAFLDYPFWLRAVARHPSKVYPGRKWLFWQYSGSGLSHGVSGRIDLNVFHGDERAWRAWAGGRMTVADAD